MKKIIISLFAIIAIEVGIYGQHSIDLTQLKNFEQRGKLSFSDEDIPLILSYSADTLANRIKKMKASNLGTYPGDIGSSVIDGHSGWKDGVPAVFDNLYELQKGDEIYIESTKGIVDTFVVQKTEEYNYDANVSDIFISKDKKAHLNLITCSGTWNSNLKSHSKRLVVFADKK